MKIAVTSLKPETNITSEYSTIWDQQKRQIFSSIDDDFNDS